MVLSRKKRVLQRIAVLLCCLSILVPFQLARVVHYWTAASASASSSSSSSSMETMMQGFLDVESSPLPVAVNGRSELQTVPTRQNEPSRTSRSTSIHTNQTHRLWLHVDDVSEGLANWRIAIVELLFVAKQIGAAFVEPCILQGRITSCHKIKQKQVTLGDVFDLHGLRQIHPWIISQQDFEKQTRDDLGTLTISHVFTFCMHAGNPSPATMCIRNGARLENVYNTKVNPVLEQALQHKGNAVIEIHTYRKGGFSKTCLQTTPHRKLLDDGMVNEALANHVKFHSKHYDMVSILLQKLKIEGNYNVIHWRAELSHMDYEKCVEQLVAAKNSMSMRETYNTSSIPTILVSSINENPFHQWGQGGVFGRARPALALKTLIQDHEFRKLDTITEKSVDDMIYLAIWDQILSQNATNFATCTKACKAKRGCKACNYQGRFGEIVIDHRKMVGRTSHQCWPS